LHGGRHGRNTRTVPWHRRNPNPIDHRSYKDRIAKAPANETQQEWYIRQKQIAVTKAELDVVNREIAALEQSRNTSTTSSYASTL